MHIPVIAGFLTLGRPLNRQKKKALRGISAGPLATCRNLSLHCRDCLVTSDHVHSVFPLLANDMRGIWAHLSTPQAPVLACRGSCATAILLKQPIQQILLLYLKERNPINRGQIIASLRHALLPSGTECLQ